MDVTKEKQREAGLVTVVLINPEGNLLIDEKLEALCAAYHTLRFIKDSVTKELSNAATASTAAAVIISAARFVRYTANT